MVQTINSKAPLDAKDFVGLALDQAVDKAVSINFTWQIVSRDGVAISVPFDEVDWGRVNLEIQDGRVNNAFFG